MTNSSRTKVVELTQEWRLRLANTYPQQSATTRESIIKWLLGNDLERFDNLTQTQLAIAQQGIAYRCQILQNRYLEVSQEQAYCHLISRLGSLAVLRQKIRALVGLSWDRQRTVVDVIQEVLQEILQRDRYIQQQITWIAECTSNSKLRNALLFASLEEYCLRPIRNQPLLVYRFINYLRQTGQGGVTQIPRDGKLRLVPEETLTDESDSSLNLLITQALATYQDTQVREEQQSLRDAVKHKFSSYLEAHLGMVAVQWFQLYLQGWSQQAIAKQLNLDIRQLYRLREKIRYHAVRVFAQRDQPELVHTWLEDSAAKTQAQIRGQQVA